MANIASSGLSITHHTASMVNDPLATQKLVQAIKVRLKTTVGLEIPLEEVLSLVDQLAEFELGRFLLHNRSMNGYWTSYIFRNQEKENRHPLEDWLLNRSLLTCARERFYRFQNILQKNLCSNMKLASVPCGLMDDLLSLDYQGFQNVEIVGVDLDEESLSLAKENAKTYGLLAQVTLLQKDAWLLQIINEFDLITSNGLNMYEADPQRVTQLYNNFYKALKPAGLLVISFLPPPPDDTASDQDYNWSNFGVSLEGIKIERTIFDVILKAKFFNFCTEKTIVQQLESVGFDIEDINYSQSGVLPIVIARK